MPKHIRRGNARAGQLALAKDAMIRLVASGIVCINDDVCTTISSQRKDSTSMWRSFASESVDLAATIRENNLTKNQAEAFRKWLRDKGYYSNGKGIYTKSGVATA